MASRKEVHFFDFDRNFRKGLDWYKGFFDQQKEKIMIGENSPLYMFSEKAPARIRELFPDVKLVFLLRDPVRRAWSHYWHEVKYGEEWLSFEKAVQKEEKRVRENFHGWRHYSYKKRGRYAEQIQRYLSYFPREQFHFVLSEKLYEDPEQEVSRLLAFLGKDASPRSVQDWLPEGKVNEGWVPKSALLSWVIHQPWIQRFPSFYKRMDRWNQKGKQPDLPEGTTVIKELNEYFAPSAQWLKQELDLDISHWNSLEKRD